MKIKLFTFFFIFSLISCQKQTKEIVDVSNVEVHTVVERFDKEFYTTSPEGLPKLKSKYPYLFPEPNADSVWVNKMQNKDEQELFAFTQEVYGDFTAQKKELNSLFQHIKYYYPKFKEPKVITVLTNVDYNNKVILADSLLFVSLDVFLGKDHEIYQDFPNYIKQNYTKEHLPVSIAEAFADEIVPKEINPNFVSQIVEEGKKRALVQAILPDVSEAEILGYTPKQLEWAENFETEIWKYFVQNEILFNNDKQYITRFIEDAPFSKFYLELDKDSPGKIGVWFGWQIVKAFRENNKVSLQQLMQINNEEIFNKSKYKPRKN